MFLVLGSGLIQPMGLFLETVSILTIAMPIFDGAIFVMNMELDLLFPPLALGRPSLVT